MTDTGFSTDYELKLSNCDRDGLVGCFMFMLLFIIDNKNGICLTSVTRAKPKEKMEFPA